jgi:hypothetical protein
VDRYSLPHGARGIESESFAIEFRGDKIVFVSKLDGEGRRAAQGKDKHYTFHAGLDSGVMDLHETESGPDGRSQRHTLFAIRRDDLPPILDELAPMLPELLGLLRPLRLGWLKHRNIGIARGVDPVSDEDIAAATRKHRGRLTLDPQLYEQHVFVPDYLDEVYDFPDGNFALFHRCRHIGIGFKKTYADGGVRLFWIKLRDLTRFGNTWQAKLARTLGTAAIPRDRYADYPFLCP